MSQPEINTLEISYNFFFPYELWGWKLQSQRFLDVQRSSRTIVIQEKYCIPAALNHSFACKLHIRVLHLPAMVLCHIEEMIQKKGTRNGRFSLRKEKILFSLYI